MIILDSNIDKQSNFKDDDLICYCFEYTKKNIEEDYLQNGYSKIIEKIKTEKKSKGCNCETLNPKGRWCLSDVHQVVEKVKGQK